MTIPLHENGANRMSYNKNKLAQHLGELLDNVRTEATGELYRIIAGSDARIEVTSPSGVKLVGEPPKDGTPTLYILLDGGRAEVAFINECLKDPQFEAEIGPEAISEKLQEIVRTHYATRNESTDLAAIVKEEIIKPLRADIKTWQVRVPIANLLVQTTLAVGTLTFIPHEDGMAANVKEIENWNGPPDDQEDTKKSRELIVAMLQQVAHQGNSWAKVQIQSHEKYLVDATKNRVEVAINLVRAFMRVFGAVNLRMGFGLPHDLAGHSTTYFASTTDRWLMPHDNSSNFRGFVINDKTLAALRKDFYLDELIQITATDWKDLKSLARAVRVAVQWIGRAIIALTPADSFMQCTIAIERLLLVDDELATTEKFAERLMFLLSGDAKERSTIYKEAKRLYGIRSDIVHAGRQTVDEADLFWIEHYALNALRTISAMLGTYSEHGQLMELLHNRKLGVEEGPDPPAPGPPTLGG